MTYEGVPLIVIQRRPGHSNLGITSIYLEGIDNEIIKAVHARRAPDGPRKRLPSSLTLAATPLIAQGRSERGCARSSLSVAELRRSSGDLPDSAVTVANEEPRPGASAVSTPAVPARARPGPSRRRAQRPPPHIEQRATPGGICDAAMSTYCAYGWLRIRAAGT
jgi:hypothetical protein